jgi:YegS/Rv2252/BmrU family lipid kinase
MPEIVVVTNASSGTAQDENVLEKLDGIIRDRGLDARIDICEEGGDLSKIARRAVEEGTRLVVAAGGDGTINAVASEVIGSETTLGVLPLGTLNHFARDLGIPDELEKAVDILVEGRTMQIDVAEVNGKIFLNNSSLGLYPSIVKKREEQQERLGQSKWVAFVWALLIVLGRYPYHRIRLDADGRKIDATTPLVFIGNNVYCFDGLDIGKRDRLDAGTLSLYIMHDVGPFALLWMMIRALFGALASAERFEAVETNSVEIATSRSSIKVATDGEVTTMNPPLTYTIRPGALTVMAPVVAPPDDTA